MNIRETPFEHGSNGRSKGLARFSRLVLLAYALAGTLAVYTAAWAASPGALDLTFGLRGTGVLNLTNSFHGTRAIVAGPDGKTIVAGYVVSCNPAPCHSDFLVVRFNANGTPDKSFDMDGGAVTDYSGQDESANAAALQTDGKLVVAGGLLDVGGAPNSPGFKLVRYLTDGSLDTSFGTGGRVFESFDNAGAIAYALAIQPDGKIVVAGTDDDSVLFVARFNMNGGLDTAFGTNGKITSDSYDVDVARLALQTDGKIVIAGTGLSAALKLIRFNVNGTLDGGFGTGGLATSTFLASFQPTLCIQDDGRIVVAGAYYGGSLRLPALRRFNADGSHDTGFVADHGPMSDASTCVGCAQKPTKVVLLPDGRFYLVGFSERSGSSLLLISVARYLSSGSIDPSFGFRGGNRFRHTNLPHSIETELTSVDDAALQSDGKIVIAATAKLPINNFGQYHVMASRVSTAVTAPGVRGDFDGDRKTDFAVFRPSDRFWYTLRSFDGSVTTTNFGATGDLVTPGDYNYDTKTDLALFRPSNNAWFIQPSPPTGGGNGGGIFGQSGDLNVPADYDGDGYTDLAVFRPSTGRWIIRYSSQAYHSPPLDESIPFGFATDKPVPADYDGDGRSDIAIFRPSTCMWWILKSSNSQTTVVPWGLDTDRPVQADYDGDKKADIAVFRNGVWYVLRSSDGGPMGFQWGLDSDVPVPGDYDGDSKTDVAVFRLGSGEWYVIKSVDGSFFGVQWGQNGDIPIPAKYLP